MAKGKLKIADFVSIAYLIVAMLPSAAILLLADIMALTTVGVIITSGFANTSMLPILWLALLAFGLSLAIPPLRRMYYRFPWLEAAVHVLAIDSILVIGAYEIFNFGYMKVDAAQHVLFAVLALVWLVGGRALHCIAMHKHPMRYIGVR